MAIRKIITTQVAIMGAGPAGLMLSHLLANAGIESTVIEVRSHKEISETVRAGILEHGTVIMLVDSGVSDRVLRDGDRHDGIELRFNGESHRVDFKDLVGESVWLYPQTDVFLDLAARRESDGGDVRYSVTDTSVHDLEGKPKVRFTDAEGVEYEIQADFVVGADGSRSHCRFQIPEAHRKWYFHEYPFAWFGPPELVYGSAEEFLHEQLLPTYVRDIGGRAAKWCLEWYFHPEAVSRVEALWRAWEHLRLDGATGISVWFKDHADHHMSVLLDPRGPFYKCDMQKHRDPEHLEPKKAPAGWFPDVRTLAT